MSFTKALKSLVAILMLLVFTSACSVSRLKDAGELAPAAPSAAELKSIVAQVNGTEITLAELDQAKKITLANRPGLQIPPLQYKEFEHQTFNQLITLELLYQASKKQEMKGLDKQAEDKVRAIKSRFPDTNAYARELQKIGIDEATLLQSARRDLAIASFVTTNIASGITIGEEEIKEFYEQNPDKFRQERRVRASHILIGLEKQAGSEEKKIAREKAEMLHKELVSGADFAKLARENSTCPSSEQGGDLGYFSKGKMVPQFEHAAFALEPGGLSGVVETMFGYHIIKLTDRKEAAEIPLSTAGDTIKEYLRAKKINEAIEAFVGQARKSAKIDILL